MRRKVRRSLWTSGGGRGRAVAVSQGFSAEVRAKDPELNLHAHRCGGMDLWENSTYCLRAQRYLTISVPHSSLLALP